MKRGLFIMLMLMIGINIYAQGTSCSEATQAEIGDNTADNSKGKQWYVYTPTTDVKITLSTCDLTIADTEVEIYTDCTSSEPLYESDDDCNMQSYLEFYGEANQTYYILWDNAHTTSSFTWTLDESVVNPGEFCANAIVAAANENNAYTLGEDSYQWFTYTATMDGKMILENLSESADSYISVYTDCGSYSIENDYDELTFECTSNVTYYIRWRNYSNEIFNWSLSESVLVDGEFCTNAIEATANENNTYTFGKDTYQWFTYTASMNGKITLENLSDSQSSYVSVYPDCGTGSLEGDFNNLIFESTEGETYYIRWNNFNSENFNWSITESVLVGGEFCSSATEATAGEDNAHILGQNANQWYNYTATQDGKLVLENLSESANSYVFIYSDCDDTYEIYAYNSIQFECSANETYYIRWKNYNLQNFNWSVSEEAISVGDFCTSTIEAVVGSNNLHDAGEGKSQWFTYEATQNGRIVLENLSESADSRVNVYTACGNNALKSADNDLSYIAVSGQTYYIKWTNYDSEDFYWSLNEVDYLDGDICSIAIAASEGNNEANNSVGNQWFSYTPTSDGTLIVTTCDLTAVDTYLYLFDNCNSGSIASSDDYCSWQSRLSYEVEADVTYYIMWSDDYTSSSYTWNLSFESDDTTTDIRELANNRVILFPNPATNQITVNTDKAIQYARMSNLQGIVVKEVANPAKTIQLDLQSGLYLVEVYFEDGTISNHKLMVK